MSYGSPEYDELLDAFKCELCNRYFRSLTKHVFTIHKIKLTDYKEMFGINKQFALQGIEISKRMAKQAEKQNNFRFVKEYNRAKKGEARCKGKMRAQARKVKNYKPINVRLDDGEI